MCKDEREYANGLGPDYDDSDDEWSSVGFSEERTPYQVVGRFEDLIAWQKAREMASAVYRLTQSGAISRDYGLSSQLQRAAVSVMANIAEGYERGSPRDFHRFLWIAKGSCGEVRSHLYVALDAGYIDSETFASYFEMCERVGQLVGGLRKAAAKRIREHRPPGQ